MNTIKIPSHIAAKPLLEFTSGGGTLSGSTLEGL
jgi:hypothetical protein